MNDDNLYKRPAEARSAYPQEPGHELPADTTSAPHFRSTHVSVNAENIQQHKQSSLRNEQTVHSDLISDTSAATSATSQPKSTWLVLTEDIRRKIETTVYKGDLKHNKETIAQTTQDDDQSAAVTYHKSPTSSNHAPSKLVENKDITSQETPEDQEKGEVEHAKCDPQICDKRIVMDEDITKLEGELSKLFRNAESQEIAQTGVCTSCLDESSTQQLARSSCGHSYCKKCINSLFEKSMIDETLFPPRCCKEVISIESVGWCLNEDLIHRYGIREIEVSTTNRVYCSKKSCGAFILPTNIYGNVATCQDCDAVTCQSCRNSDHPGDCPTDKGFEQLMELAKQEHWKRCPKCGFMIELDTGCNHMTCKCHHQFCYACSQTWKTCSCPQFEEENLVARARELQERLEQEDLYDDFNFEHDDPTGGDADMNPLVHLIMNRHECPHPEWLLRQGTGQCEHCQQLIATWTYRCRRCMLRVCEDCRFHRL